MGDSCPVHVAGSGCDNAGVTGDRILLDDLGFERAKRLQTIQHVLVAGVMLVSGYRSLAGAEASLAHRGTAILQLGAGSLLFLAIAVERRRQAAMSHARFGWIEIASGVLLFAEGLVKHHDGKWFHADYFSGVLFILLGLFEGPFSRWRSGRRYLEDDATVLRGRTGPLRGFRIAWSDIQMASSGTGTITLEKGDGKSRSIRLSRYRNKEAVRTWLEDRLARRGIPIE